MKMFLSFLVISISLVNCQGCGPHFTGQVEQPISAVSETKEHSQLPSNDENNIQSQRAESSYASFEPETLYALLVAEVAIDRSQYDVALVNYLHQAFATRDPGVAKRAFELAQYIGSAEIILEAVRLWVEVEPDNLEANQFAAVYFLRAQQFDKAISYMETLLQLKGDTDFGYLALSAKNLSGEERSELISAYDRLITKYPENEELMFGKAVLLEQNMKYEESLIVAEKLLKVNKKNTQAILLSAQLLHQLTRSQEALKRLNKSLSSNPNEKRVRLLYARILVDTKKLDKAQEQFAILVKQSPEDGELILSLALVSIDNKAYAEAEKYLKQVIELGQYLDEANYYLGRIAEENNELELAISHYKKVVDGHSVLPAYSRYANILAERDNFKELQTRFNNARSTYINQAIDFYLLESSVLIDHERYQLAQQALDKAINDYPENIELLYTRAMLSEKQNNIAALERDLRQALKIEPENPVVLNALGYTLADLTDRYDEALELITQAMALDPENPAIIDSMGWVHYRLGNMEKALTFLHKAYEAFPDHEVAAHLGEVLWLQGDHVKAEKIWQQGLESRPDSEIIKNTIKRLKPAQSFRETGPVGPILD